MLLLLLLLINPWNLLLQLLLLRLYSFTFWLNSKITRHKITHAEKRTKRRHGKQI